MIPRAILDIWLKASFKYYFVVSPTKVRLFQRLAGQCVTLDHSNMKRTFLCVLSKTPWVLAHACLLTCIVSPLVLWSVRVIPEPTPFTESAGGIKIHGTGIPRGIPSQEEMAYPGHFRVWDPGSRIKDLASWI